MFAVRQRDEDFPRNMHWLDHDHSSDHCLGQEDSWEHWKAVSCLACNHSPFHCLRNDEMMLNNRIECDETIINLLYFGRL